MAHFAKLDENNVVTEVVVVDNDIPTANGPIGENDMHPDGEAWCAQHLGGTWKQTFIMEILEINLHAKEIIL